MSTKLASVVLLAISFQLCQGLRGHQRELLSHLLHEQDAEPARQTILSEHPVFSGFPSPYIVKPGDSLSSIASETSANIEDIRSMNYYLPLPKDDDASLAVGLAMNVPGYPGVPPLPTTIAVRDAQSLEFFRLAYNIDLDALQNANPKLDIENINKLTTVRVPLPEAYPEIECPSRFICVKATQSLHDIAMHYDDDVEALLASNPQVLKQGGRLFVGQLLNQPGNEPVLPDRMVTFHAHQNPYNVLLTTMGLPITVSYLSQMAATNDRTIAELLSLCTKMSLWETQNPAKVDVQMPTLSSTATAPERRMLAAMPERRMLTANGGGGNGGGGSGGNGGGNGGGGGGGNGNGNGPPMYGRKLFQDARTAPILSQLHFGEGHQLLSNDAIDSIGAGARKLRHVLHPSKVEEAEELDSISSAASRLFNMLHTDEEELSAGRRLQSAARGRRVQEPSGGDVKVFKSQRLN